MKRLRPQFFLFVFAYVLTSSALLNAQNQDKFKPTEESLKQYAYPEWFRDAKFGIWAHWGPQAVPRQGDWYARNMYINDDIEWRTKEHKGPSAQYKYHLAHYGHPSKFGYKDIIPLWKAEKWEPEKLMALYKKAGAKYFVSMGSHHDNFFLWDSKIHKWNAVNMGPKKDVVGIWQKAAQKEGLRFGVSEHLAASYTWFQASHGSDKEGPLAGVPYDGADSTYQDLYHTKAAPDDHGWLTTNPEWHKEWLADVKELIDLYHPDLLYSDSELPFGEIGRNMLAYYYNQDMTKNRGNLQAVYNCKKFSNGMWVEDVERGAKDTINPFPWQTDTSIGDWYYRTGQRYKTPTEIVQMLIDIVSKNGNLLINIVQTPEGDLEPDMIKTLEDIGAWIAVNGEGIYGSRPWKIYGEGPSTGKKQEKGQFGGIKDVRSYSVSDIRFTTKGDLVYAFVMGVPAEKEIVIKSFAIGSPHLDGKKVNGISLLGYNGKLKWTQTPEGLKILLPAAMPCNHAVTFKIQESALKK
jgi:alpha-L-fucosidase